MYVKTKIHLIQVSSLLVSALFLAGCAKRMPEPASDDGVTTISRTEYVKLTDIPGGNPYGMAPRGREEMVSVGDRLTINIYDKLPVSQEKNVEMKRVDDDSTVLIIPAGKVKVAGLLISQAERTLEAALAPYLVSPFCEIAITQHYYEPRVYVFGEVMKTGTVPVQQGDRLLDVLSAAGGCASNAYRRSIKVIRLEGQNVTMMSINLQSVLADGRFDGNVALQDQDVVFVPRRFFTNFQEVMTVIGNLLPYYYFTRNFQ